MTEVIISSEEKEKYKISCAIGQINEKNI